MNRGSLPIINLNFPKPKLGNKIFCTQEHGIYVLERGPTIIQGIMCTHAGSGGVTFYDGVPGSNGFFPDEQLRPGQPGYETANGRIVWIAAPSLMGMYMAGGGLEHGLTVIVNGASSAVSAHIIVTWQQFTPLARKIL